MNLPFTALLGSLSDLAKEKGVRDFTVDHKRNARGDLVVAIIIRDREGPYSPDAIPGTPSFIERKTRSTR